MADLVGKTLGVYRLENSLGRGGMATVYRAYQATIKRYVAIKVMAADIASDPGFVERFTREAEVIASLQHPHILPVIDYGEADGVHYLVMRYLDGGSLEDRMRTRPLKFSEASRFIEQIASALDYAHKRGVIHRDFKASNVLLDDDDNPYLTDFGIARLASSISKLTATGTVMGTPAYMSPEQAMGLAVDGRSDIYSFGVVVYEMMTHRLPFMADTPAALVFQHVYEQPASPRQLNPLLPEAVEQVILRALAKNPDDRYSSAGEMARAFSEAVQSSPVLPDSQAMEGTLIGGPLTPLTPAAIPFKRGTPASSRPLSTVPVAPTVGTAAPATPARHGLPVALIVAALVVLLLISGAFVLLSSGGQNTDHSTQTAAAVALANTTRSAQTQIALALSATATTTNTAAASATPSASATPTDSPSPRPTPTITVTSSPAPSETVNATLTRVAQQIETVAAFQAGQTATEQQAQSNQTATASAPTVTSTLAPTNQPTVAPTLAPTNNPISSPSVLTASPVDSTSNYQGDPETVLAALKSDGQLTDSSGEIGVNAFSASLVTKDVNSFTWGNSKMDIPFGDFVMSAEISWEGANQDDSCGVLFHFNKPTPNVNAFHSVFIDPNSQVRVITHQTGQDDVAVLTTTTPQINTATGAINQLLVIGQGNAYRVFVNGKRVASFSPKTRFDNGPIGVVADTGASGGVTCHFRNVWAWHLGTVSGNANDNTASPSTTPTAESGSGSADLSTALISNTPSDVIAALERVKAIPTGAVQLTQQPFSQLSASSYKNNQGGRYVLLTTQKIHNLVLSVDMVLTLPEGGACGLFYNAEPTKMTNLTAFFLESNSTYEAYNQVNGTWSSTAVTGSNGSSPLFVVDGKTSNRLTLVVVNGLVTIYVNGSVLASFPDPNISDQTSGAVGYYLDKYKSSVTTDSCILRNATLWQLP